MTSAHDPRRPTPIIHRLLVACALASSLLIAACVVGSAQRAAGGQPSGPEAAPAAAANPRAVALPTSKSMAALPARTTARAMASSKSAEPLEVMVEAAPPAPLRLPQPHGGDDAPAQPADAAREPIR